MWAAKRFVLETSLAPDVVAHRLRMALGERGIFSGKGKHFSGSVSASGFQLTPISGGDLLPVFLGTLSPSKDGGTTIIVERRLGKMAFLFLGGITAGITISIVLVAVEIWIIALVLLLYLPLHFLGFTWMATRGERKLRQLCENTDGRHVSENLNTT
jgi:hypothetical protein